MSKITLTINGKQVEGQDGSTVLEVCQANGIYLPTLCHLDGLSDVGACRMCIVEIERERRPVPACTYPAQNRLVIRTHTERLEKYRRQVLEILFTERNHYCPFCEASGQCELQKLGYQYQIDHIRYPYIFPSLQVDASNKYWVLDQNRCILCGRCIRACNEIAANHTLEFGRRGFKERIAVDINQTIAESSCLNYGACVQACPTGAIFDKFSLYKGKEDECQKVDTICPSCGVACEIKVLTKDNNLVKIKAPGFKDNPRASLCRMGRFELVAPKPPRVISPMVKGKSGEFEECSLDRAAEVLAKRLAKNNNGFSGMVSARLPSQTLKAFKRFMNEVIGSDSIDTIDGASSRLISEGINRFQKTTGRRGLDIECPIEDIMEANSIILVGADPDLTNPVVSALVRRSVDLRKTKLVVINTLDKDILPLWTTLLLKPKPGSEGTLLNGLAKMLIDQNPVSGERVSAEFRNSLVQYEIPKVVKATGIDKKSLESVRDIYGLTKPGIVIYGEGLLQQNDAGLITTILYLANITGNQTQDKLRVISLKPRANSRGAWELMLTKGINDKSNGLYLLLADELDSETLLPHLKGTGFLVVQASYHSPITEMADVVLPSPMWAEREGEYVSQDGRFLQANRVLEPSDGLLQDEAVFTSISQKMGHNLVLN